MTLFAPAAEGSMEETLSGTLCKQGDCCIKGGGIYYGMHGGILRSNKRIWGLYKLIMGCFGDWPKEEEGRG